MVGRKGSVPSQEDNEHARIGNPPLSLSFKDTLFLPKTALPMKAPSLPAPVDTDPGNPTGPSFVLHDGPPYANGRLHMGHALNRLLKDMVLRDRRRRGFHAPLLPNWDCHGLPLEKRLAERRGDFTSRRNYLGALASEAATWANAQAEGMRSLGVGFADADRTLSCEPRVQALVMKEFHRLVKAGLVYQRDKPTTWSPMDQTVLADAETVDVEREVDEYVAAFPLTDPLHDGPAALAVWSTTPWSLPGNVAVGWNPDAAYGLYNLDGRHVVCSDEGAPQMLPSAERLRSVSSEELAHAVPRHPLHNHGYPMTGLDHKLVPANFVDPAKGCGFVHLGPAHSVEDWMVWSEPYPNVVDEQGCYTADLPLFAGLAVVHGGSLGPADKAVLEALQAEGNLLARNRRVMTLRRSWRSEGLLVTRSTSQWFVNLSDARERAVSAVESGQVKMVPPVSQARFLSMLRTRPDWLVSRQREWGVPLGLFAHKVTGEPLADPKLLDATVQLVAEDGVAAWWETSDADLFAAAGRSDNAQYERVTAVLDVWFDSACVASYGAGPADLVVEGSDQHRGWFSSTLMKACALGDPMPFRTVYTHGFVVDDTKEKMSKSKGNGVSPEEAAETHGADVLRLWAALVDPTTDVPFNPQLLEEAKRTRDKLRNALRYLTGVLRDWSDRDATAPVDDPHDLLLLSEVSELVTSFNAAGDQYDFRGQLELVRDFVDRRLSAHHVDVRKDLLYCRAYTAPWHAARSALMRTYNELLSLLTSLAPVMVSELAQCLTPQLECAALPKKPNLDLRDRLYAVDAQVNHLMAEAGLKPANTVLTLTSEHEHLLGMVDHAALARWLKVDQILTDTEMSVSGSQDPVCPRCRRHMDTSDNGLCVTCDTHVRAMS